VVDVTTPPSGGGDRVEPVDIQIEMQRSYIDYAMSVIVGRALPDVRDGLKPVHRKILYGMFDSGFRPDRPYVKCARVVGDVMGNYHPHGDSRSTTRWCGWPSRGRCGRRWSTVRATSARPATTRPRHALHRVPAHAARHGDAADIDEETVDFVPNYDGDTASRRPARRIPNLLVNGSRASRSAWRRTSRRTTCARSPRRALGARAPGRRRRGALERS
jgi:DNA gyrase subunit A